MTDNNEKALEEYDLCAVGKTPDGELLYAVPKDLDETIRKALQQPKAVDVEALKLQPATNKDDALCNAGWNECIDHLQAKGYIQPKPKPSSGGNVKNNLETLY